MTSSSLLSADVHIEILAADSLAEARRLAPGLMDEATGFLPRYMRDTVAFASREMAAGRIFDVKLSGPLSSVIETMEVQIEKEMSDDVEYVIVGGDEDGLFYAPRLVRIPSEAAAAIVPLVSRLKAFATARMRVIDLLQAKREVRRLRG